MNITANCPECGKPVGVNALQGLCPECMMKVGLGSGVSGGPNATLPQSRPFTPPSLEDLAPSFPQLEILEFLGRGGMGAVYKARQKTLDRLVALKILPPGGSGHETFAERFVREAKAMARLNHPGIVAIYDFGCVRQGTGRAAAPARPPADSEPPQGPGGGDLYFFIMEYVEGINLRQLQQAQHLASREALAIVPQICDALQYAHDQGIVHRDIKPENIMVDRQGRVKVADFGLAKLMGWEDPIAGASRAPSEPALTQEGKVMGTPHYMAPEQIQRPLEVDHRADIYSLGVVFYQMLTGELPGQRLDPPSLKVRVDVRLDEVVLRALEKQPERRYQQASQIKSDVETIAATPSSVSEKDPTAQTSESLDQLPAGFLAINKRLRFLAGALVLLGVIAFLLMPLSGIVVSWFVTNLPETPYRQWDEFLQRATYFNTGGLAGALALLSAWSIYRGWGRQFALVAILISSLHQPLLWPLTLPLGYIALRWWSSRQVQSGLKELEQWRRGLPVHSSAARQGLRWAMISTALVWFSLLCLPVYQIDTFGLVYRNRLEAALLHSVMGVVPFAFTISAAMGWLALETLRSSHHSAKGLGLALFGAVYAPFLSLVNSLRPISSGTLLSEGWSGHILLNHLWTLLPVALAAWWIDQRRSSLAESGNEAAARSFANRIGWIVGIIGLLFFGSMLYPQVIITAEGMNISPKIDSFHSDHLHREMDLGNKTNLWTITLLQGKLGLQTISEPAATNQSCWLPDGTVRCPWNPAQSQPADPPADGRELIFFFDSTFPPDTFDSRHIECRANSPSGLLSCPQRLVSNYSGMQVLATVPNGSQTAALTLGVSAGNWEDTDARWTWTGDARLLKKKAIRRGNQDWEIKIQMIYSSAQQLSVSYLCPPSQDWRARLVAIDAQGQVYEPEGNLSPPIVHKTVLLNPFWLFRSPARPQVDQPSMGYENFRGIDQSQLRELRFQIQPLRKVEFRNLSLQPGFKTSVESIVMKDASSLPEAKKLENLLRQEQAERLTDPKITVGFDTSHSQVTYAFDNSFRYYFGEKGEVAVQRALKLINENPIIIESEQSRNQVELDFLSNPLQIEEKW